MRYGWREGRNPSPDFNTMYYRDAHLGGADINPVHHYIAKGRARRLATCPIDEDEYLDYQQKLSKDYFSEKDYRQRSGYTGEDALRFYLRAGWRNHIPPSFLFDSRDYIAANSHVEALGICPLYHFASQRRLMGEAPIVAPDVLTRPADGTLIRSFDAPDYAMAPPNLTELEAMPAVIRSTLQPVWNLDKVGGRPVAVYHLRDVYVACEGLVFTSDAQLIDVTRTYHSDFEIQQARLAVLDYRGQGTPRALDKGILAESRGATNYGHFILEMLPRAWLARSWLNLDWPAIIHAASAPMQEVARQALGCAGFPSDRIVAIGRDPVFVRELVFVDGLTNPPYISTLALQCLDEATAHVPASSIRKVYAPRAPAFTRDFEDEPAAAAAFAGLGYERVATFGMTFEAQVALFRGATEVVGVSGAALTNILFCRPGTRIVVFSPAGAAELLFWLIAERRGLVYEEVRCREIGPQLGALPWDRSIRIGSEDLARLTRG